MIFQKCLYALIVLSTAFFSQATYIKSVYIGVCETSQACILKNIRKSLPNRESVNFIQHKEEGLVYRYDTISITNEFGLEIYFTETKGIVENELNTVVNAIVEASDVDKSFESEGYIRLSENLYSNINGGIPVYDSFLTGLPNISFMNSFTTGIKTTIIVDDSLWQSLDDVLSQAEIGISAGSQIFQIDGKLVFKPSNSFNFGVKQGGAIVVFKYSGDNITPLSIVFIDAETFEPILEVPITDGQPDFSSLIGNSLTISSSTQSLWNNTFKSLSFFGPCDSGKCVVIIKDE